MKDTRQIILNYLRERGEATVAELAKQVALTPVSVHYHLGRMESEGLVTSTPLRHGVGRPKSVYSLSETALELFPQANHRLADRMLDALQTRLSERQIEEIFEHVVAGITAEHDDKFHDKSLAQKIDALIELMGLEGFIARVEQDGCDFQLTQCGCPYQYVAQRHPGICSIDLQLINTTLGAEVKRDRWILDGDNVCTFHVKAEAGT